MPTRPTIAVDLDGTIAEYEAWLGEEIIGKPIAGAIEFLEELSAAGFDVVIFSARACTLAGSNAIWAWIAVNKLEQIVSEVTNVKQYRFAAFVDDRAIRFSNNFSEIASALRKQYGDARAGAVGGGNGRPAERG